MSFYLHRRPPVSTLFPYTTLFRSIAFAVIGPERFVELGCVLFDDGIGRLKDILGGTIVLFQRYLDSIFIVRFKIENIGDIGSPEGVDTLGVVPDHTDIFILLCQQARHLILCVIGILILINQDIAELVLILFKNIGMLCEQLNRFDKKIIKIHGVGLNKPVVVILIHPCGDIIQCTMGGHLSVLIRQNKLILGITNFPVDRFGFDLFGIVPQLFQDQLDGVLRVAGVVDREIGGKPDLFSFKT